jgi:HEAT repeat protein
VADLDLDIVRAHNRARRAGDWRALIPLLKPHRADGIIARILRTLGEIGDPKSVPAIIDYLKRDRRVGVQWKGATALGRIRDPRAIPTLRGIVVEFGAPPIYAAVEALGEIGGPDALEALRRAPRRNRLVRTRLAEALGKIGGEEAVEMLAELTHDPMTSVRHRAYQALIRIGSPLSADALEHSLPSVRSPIWRMWIERSIRRVRATSRGSRADGPRHR